MEFELLAIKLQQQCITWHSYNCTYTMEKTMLNPNNATKLLQGYNKRLLWIVFYRLANSNSSLQVYVYSRSRWLQSFGVKLQTNKMMKLTLLFWIKDMLILKCSNITMFQMVKRSFRSNGSIMDSLRQCTLHTNTCNYKGILFLKLS